MMSPPDEKKPESNGPESNLPATGPWQLVVALGFWTAWPAMIITGMVVFVGAFHAVRQGISPEASERLLNFTAGLLIQAGPLAILFLLRRRPFILPFRTAWVWYVAVQAFSAVAHLAAPAG